MAKKIKEQEINLFYMNNSGAEKKSVPQREKAKKHKKKNKEKKKNIKDNTNSVNNKKQTKKRRISKKKVAIFIAKWTSILALVIGCFIFLTTTPIFYIKNINVFGNNQISSDEIISLSEIKRDTNLFKNTKSQIIKNIKQNAYINNVVVKRKLPDTIEITVEEKQKMFMLQFVNGYAYIDNQGYILQISNENINLPILKGYETIEEEILEGNRLCNNDLEKLQTAIKIIYAINDAGIQQLITNIDITDKQEYSIYIESEKKVIYVGDGSNLTDKMLYAKAIIENEKGKTGEIFLNGDLNNKFQPYFREKV